MIMPIFMPIYLFLIIDIQKVRAFLLIYLGGYDKIN